MTMISIKLIGFKLMLHQLPLIGLLLISEAKKDTQNSENEAEDDLESDNDEDTDSDDDNCNEK